MAGEGQRFRCLVASCDASKTYSLTTLYEHLSYHCKDMGFDSIFEYKCTNCKGAFFTNRMFMVAHKKQFPRHQITRCDDIDINNINKKISNGVDTMNNVLLRKMFEPIGTGSGEHVPRRLERSPSRCSVKSTYYPQTPYARSPAPSRATTPSHFLREHVHPDMSNDYANASSLRMDERSHPDISQQNWQNLLQKAVREDLPIRYQNPADCDGRSATHAEQFQSNFSSNRDRSFGDDNARTSDRRGRDDYADRRSCLQNRERSAHRGDGDRNNNEFRRGRDDRDSYRGGGGGDHDSYRGGGGDRGSYRGGGGDRFNRNNSDFRGGRDGGDYNGGSGDRNRDDSCNSRGDRGEKNDFGGFRGRRDSYGGDRGRGDNGGFRGRGRGGGFRGRGGGRGGFNRNNNDNQSRYGSPSRDRNGDKNRSRSRSPHRNNQAVNRSYSRSRSRSGSPSKPSQRNSPADRNETKKNERRSYSRSPQRSP